MRFTIDVMQQTMKEGVQPTRVDTFSDLDQVKQIHTAAPHFVKIFDNLSGDEFVAGTWRAFQSIKEQLEERECEGNEAAARAAQWKPEKPFIPSMTLEGVADKLKPAINLKNAIGVTKAPLHPVPPIAFVALGQAMADGKAKSALYNWRESEATVSIFIDALLRHVLDYISGVNHASDSKVHHLAHVMADCAILLDAELHGKLIDDRHSVNGKVITDMLKLLKAE